MKSIVIRKAREQKETGLALMYGWVKSATHRLAVQMVKKAAAVAAEKVRQKTAAAAVSV